MALNELLASLENDLARDLPRNSRSFAEARLRHRELAPYDTIGALLEALGPSSRLGIAARRGLITALVIEAQRSKCSFASAVLVVGFAPMLRRLRKRIGSARANDDLDSAILVAFAAAVRAVRPDRYTALALRWATEKEVLTARRAEQRLGASTPFDEEIHSPAEEEATELRDMVAEAVRALQSDYSAELMDMFILTHQRDETLRQYVFRTCANPRDRTARYTHLHRARRRFERELRKRLSASPRRVPLPRELAPER